MKYQKPLIGILIMTFVLWIYTNLIVTFVNDIASQVSTMLMGLPLLMGAVVYFINDYVNKMFNK